MTRLCDTCSQPYEAKRPHSRFCSGTCRVRAGRRGLSGDRPEVKGYGHRPCTVCGGPMKLGPTSASTGNAHRACRGMASRTCPDCGGTKHPGGDRCRRCRDAAQRIRPDDDSRVRRRQRERLAPGLSASERDRLQAKWRRQGRRCAYCDDLADTIDHAVPLVRGGTNFEGNLVPACRACNSGKQARLLIEWRSRRPAARTYSPRRQAKASPPRIEPIRGEQLEMFRACVCGMAHSRNSDFCSERCQARSRYRLKVGIPLAARPYEVRAA